MFELDMQFRLINVTFLVITLLIAAFDALLIWVNYRSSEEALQQSLAERGAQVRDSYRIALEQVGGFMRQTATYIANDERVTSLFYAGAKAVEEEGGGPGGQRAAAIRDELFDLVARSWTEMTRNYKGRQLHFHLPPDVSFLRVHAPHKFGDDLSAIRHSIMATNTQQIETAGFESGRVYAGIRGVVPVYHRLPGKPGRIHVGALEAGTSFSLMLHQLRDVLSIDFAVMMTLRHAGETMWPDFLEQYKKSHPVVAGHLFEAGTEKADTLTLLENEDVRELLGSEGTLLASLHGRPVAVTAFSLRDYLGTVDPQRDAIGTILVWTSAEKEVGAFQRSFYTNLFIAIVGFLLIEALIVWALRREDKLRLTESLAQMDELTGLPNRRSFNRVYAGEVAQARRRKETLSVAMCDIDYFKQFNDLYGHAQGDECLKQVAAALGAAVYRADDYVARYGGEEFVVILPNTDLAGAKKAAEGLCEAVRGLKIPHEAGGGVGHITLSCGVASMDISAAAPGAIAERLLKQADAALYKAKQNGRDRYAASETED
jgi:diguanylate cyclase (GGDEF)-like protein